jgi:hypothetical protein
MNQEAQNAHLFDHRFIVVNQDIKQENKNLLYFERSTSTCNINNSSVQIKKYQRAGKKDSDYTNIWIDHQFLCTVCLSASLIYREEATAIKTGTVSFQSWVETQLEIEV